MHRSSCRRHVCSRPLHLQEERYSWMDLPKACVFLRLAGMAGITPACASTSSEIPAPGSTVSPVRRQQTPLTPHPPEWGFLQIMPLSDASPESDYVKAVARQMHARLQATSPPPMWTHWYRYYHDITEQLFLQNLDELADIRESIPYQVVELDDGYQHAWGDWTRTNARFPHGLEWLADQNISQGFNTGFVR